MSLNETLRRRYVQIVQSSSSIRLEDDPKFPELLWLVNPDDKAQRELVDQAFLKGLGATWEQVVVKSESDEDLEEEYYVIALTCNSKGRTAVLRYRDQNAANRPRGFV